MHSYQRIHFRNLNNPMTRPSVSVRTESKHAENSHDSQVLSDRYVKPMVEVVIFTCLFIRSSHIFDGKIRHSETASFQLCDIVDPLLEEMINSPEAISDVYDVSLSSVTYGKLSVVVRIVMDGIHTLISRTSKLSCVISFFVCWKGIYLPT